MAARMRPDYKIRKEFHSTFDPLKHHHHNAPLSPLYRPGQEQRMDRMEPKADLDGLNDHSKIPSLPLNDDFDQGHQRSLDEDRTPRLTDRLDPRFGSAKGPRESISPPFGNAMAGRESKMSTNNRNDHNINNSGSYTSRDLEEYLKYRARQSSGEGGSPNNDGPLYNGSGSGGVGTGGGGVYTNRGGHRSYMADSPDDKPWTNVRYNTPNRVVDPRQGSMLYADMGGPNRLRHGGALLFIRFPTGSGPNKNDNIAVASQAFLRSKTHDMGGKFLGLAKSIQDFGYPDGPKEAMGVYHFPSPEKALLFFQYDMTIRQPDFPPPYGHAEMWIVSNAYLPDNMSEYKTFLLSEVMLHDGRDKREFFEVFQKPFESYLSKNGVMPFVICSYGSHDRQSLRRHSYHRHAIVTCHLFQGVEHLRWINDDETYLKYRSLHNQMAEEKCMVFTLDRNLCP